MTTLNKKTEEVKELATSINEILHGRSMEVVGTVLITMVAIMITKVSKTDEQLEAGMEAVFKDTRYLVAHMQKEGLGEEHHVH